jgi:predicted PurR-regulated permease PerM
MTAVTPARPDAPPPHSSVLFYVILAAALLIFIQTFVVLSAILLSLLLIVLISLAVNPVIAWMHRWAGGRKRAAGLLTLFVVGLMGLTVWAFIVPMKGSVSQLTENLPGYWERLQKPLIKLEQQAVTSEKKLQAEVTTEIAREKAAASELDVVPVAAEPVRAEPDPAREPESDSDPATGPIRSTISEVLQDVGGRFTAMAFNAAQFLIVFATVFFGVIFTLMNPGPIFGSVFALVPGRHHQQTLTILQRIGEFIPRWAAATLVSMVTIGLLVFLLMWPIFGFTDALILGLIAGVFEAIPFIGPILSAAPALLLAFGEGGLTPLWVLLAYVLVQALEGNVIMPMIMARGMSLHPVAVIFSMLLCVAAFGALGVLVAAPLVAIVRILHEELYRKRFLPLVTDADLARLSRQALHDKMTVKD